MSLLPTSMSLKGYGRCSGRSTKSLGLSPAYAYQDMQMRHLRCYRIRYGWFVLMAKISASGHAVTGMITILRPLLIHRRRVSDFRKMLQFLDMLSGNLRWHDVAE